MKYSRKILVSLFWVVLGVVLVGCCMAGVLEEFWNGMGIAFLVVGSMQVIRQIKYRANRDYRETVDIELNDERNRYISSKAWAWAGYLFVLVAAVGSIVFKVVGKEELMMLSAGSVSILMLFYWVSYMCLKRKY